MDNAELRAGNTRPAMGLLTTDRIVAVIVLVALVIVVGARVSFSGALGD